MAHDHNVLLVPHGFNTGIGLAFVHASRLMRDPKARARAQTAFESLLDALECFEAAHPSDPPHYYLSLVGLIVVILGGISVSSVTRRLWRRGTSGL
jgi:hypothetical protein